MTRPWIGPAIAVLLAACGAEAHEQLGGETNWLNTCQDDDDCSVGSCVCSLCTDTCDADEGCQDGLLCQPGDSMLVSAACGADPEPGLCAPECDDDAQCGSGQRCTQDACLPDSLAGGTSASSGLSEPPGLLITGHHSPDANCNKSGPLLPAGQGRFDISRGSFDQINCEQPYFLNLEVLNPGSERVQLDRAIVRIMTVDEATILFERFQPPLVNPMEVVVTGPVPASTDGQEGIAMVGVEAIPVAHARQLDAFLGESVLIRVTLSGFDLSGAVANSQLFEYTLRICDGCLSVCQGSLEAEMTIDDLSPGQCRDDAGADGRYCVDADC